MNRIFLFVVLMATISFTLVSCDEDADTVEIIDSSLPTGDLQVNQSGTFTAQNDTPTAGTVQIGVDDDNRSFLSLSDDFTTAVATGTVTVYLSTSEAFITDPGNGNPDLRLIGAVQENGAHFFEVEGGVDSKFTHVILWCASANIPFGFASLGN
ncbi:MAG: DM13 domain-containing protein [Bacteroidota bacterium]